MLKSVINGKTPIIPEDIKKDTNPIISSVRNIIAKCYQYNPNDRPNARSIEKEISLLFEKHKTNNSVS